MVGKTNSRNTTQRAGKIIRASGRIINANLGIYTVPANTEARVTDLQAKVDAVGTDASYAVAIKNGAVFTSITLFKVPADGLFTASAVTMSAGEILTNIGNAGAKNGTFDLSCTIEEFGV